MPYSIYFNIQQNKVAVAHLKVYTATVTPLMQSIIFLQLSSCFQHDPYYFMVYHFKLLHKTFLHHFDWDETNSWIINDSHQYCIRCLTLLHKAGLPRMILVTRVEPYTSFHQQHSLRHSNLHICTKAAILFIHYIVSTCFWLQNVTTSSLKRSVQ